MTGLMMFGIDLTFLLVAGAVLMRLPNESSEAPPAGSFLARFATIIGVVTMLRAGWHLIGIGAVFSMINSESEAATSLHVFAIAIIASTLTELVVGFLCAQQRLIERSASPFIKDTFGEIASGLWSIKKWIAIGAFGLALLLVLMPSFLTS